MFHQTESVPFAFIAETARNRFVSDVTPPARPRPSRRRLTGNVLSALGVAAGLVSAVILGSSALLPASGSYGSPRVVTSSTHR
jgi:hypothetical protein